MNDLFVFNKTAQGYSHIVKNRPCEDFSDTYTDPEKKYCIIAVADGHGSESCFRSNKGSEFAVSSAIDCLRKFADYYLSNDASENHKETDLFIEQINSTNSRNALLKQLTDSIIYQWNEKVKNDIEQNPISNEEMEKTDNEYSSLYKEEKKLNHIYGTTLIAALRLKRYLIIIHQGDGRCDVIYDDGSVDQPVPWDDKCHENITTSMCDDDAAQKIRYAIIDTNEKGVAACYLGSDGVEDSYRTMEGTHVFYMKLSNKITTSIDNKDTFLYYLGEFLPEFSKSGSGDDVSVAGIIDTDKISSLKNIFEEKINKYIAEESILHLKAKIDSMSRKHSILKKRKEIAEEALKKQVAEYTKYKIYGQLKNSIKQMQIDDILEKDVISALLKSCPSIGDILNNTSLEEILSFDSGFNSDLEKFIQMAKLKQSEAWEELKKSADEFKNAGNEFLEYDRKYQALINQLIEMEEKINNG